MLDILCVLDDEVNRFTWCSADKSTKSRLDYIFFNEEWDYHLKAAYTKTVITSEIGKRLTDHKAMVATFSKKDKKRSPGYWKLNCEYLKDCDYKTGINRVIDDLLLEYKDSNLCKRVTWDVLKLKIKEFSLNSVGRKHMKKRIE